MVEDDRRRIHPENGIWGNLLPHMENILAGGTERRTGSSQQKRKKTVLPAVHEIPGLLEHGLLAALGDADTWETDRLDAGSQLFRLVGVAVDEEDPFHH